MMFSSKNGGKVTVEDKFPCAVCRKDVGGNSILFHFCMCWCLRFVVIIEVN